MPKSRQYKLIIDTNLWISFIISNKHTLLDAYLFSGKIRLLFSTELITEIEQATKKPKLSKYFGSNEFNEMFSVFDPFIDLIDIKSTFSICRDRKDNFLLALAKDGKADFLLTGDSDLLVLNKIEKTKIITITRFWEEMKKGG